VLQRLPDDRGTSRGVLAAFKGVVTDISIEFIDDSYIVLREHCKIKSGDLTYLELPSIDNLLTLPDMMNHGRDTFLPVPRGDCPYTVMR